MNKKILMVVGGAILLIVLGYLATQVGGIAIRGTGLEGESTGLTVVQPLLPGVDTIVRWDASPTLAGQQAQVSIRTSEGSEVIGEAEAQSGQAVASIPCVEDSSDVSLVLWFIDSTGQSEVVAWQGVEVLPAGPDCFQ